MIATRSLGRVFCYERAVTARKKTVLFLYGPLIRVTSKRLDIYRYACNDYNKHSHIVVFIVALIN